MRPNLYAHSRVERSVGVNRQGYRGPVVGRKQPGERRVVMLGGSTVFGFDVAWEDTVPAVLDRMLKEQEPGTRVINLGFIGEGALAFLPTLKSYAYLDFDVVCLYEGYNDVLGDTNPNTFLLRHQSPVFRMTGYFPVLPLVLREKAMTFRHGSVAAAYDAGRNGKGQTVFRPNLANRTSAAALEAAAAAAQSLGNQLDRLSETHTATPTGEQACVSPWSHYCNSVYVAVQHAVSNGKSVLVASQPRLRNDRSARHASQRRALADMLSRKFGHEPRVQHVDLDATVDLSRQDLAFDGLHLNLAGNTMVASALIGPVRAALARQRASE